MEMERVVRSEEMLLDQIFLPILYEKELRCYSMFIIVGTNPLPSYNNYFPLSSIYSFLWIADFTHSSSSSSTATLGEPQLPVLQTASLLRLNDVSEEMAALQREKEQQQATLRQEVETALDLDEVLRDLAFISGMMEEDEEEEEEEDDGRESGANGNEMDKGSLQEEYVSLRQAYRQMDEERAKQQQQQQQQQPESTGVVSSMENEEVISLKRPEPSQSVDEMLGVREIDRESNVSILSISILILISI